MLMRLVAGFNPDQGWAICAQLSVVSWRYRGFRSGRRPRPKSAAGSRSVVCGGVQFEDGTADVLDHGLQVGDRPVQPSSDLARSGPGDGALQIQTDSEDPLNHMVVQFMRDPLTVGQHSQMTGAF